MTDWLLVRELRLPDRTEGRLTLPSGWWCFTLEDPIHGGPKVHGETAIQEGRYRLTITASSRFHRLMPLVVDVPGFTGIRLHGGNTTADTAGCILLGMTRTLDGISNCAPALKEVVRVLSEAMVDEVETWLSITTPQEGELRA